MDTYTHICLCMNTINTHHVPTWPSYLHLTHANCPRVTQAFSNTSMGKHWLLTKALAGMLVHHWLACVWHWAIDKAIFNLPAVKQHPQNTISFLVQWVAQWENWCDKEARKRRITCFSSRSDRAAALIIDSTCSIAPVQLETAAM